MSVSGRMVCARPGVDFTAHTLHTRCSAIQPIEVVLTGSALCEEAAVVERLIFKNDKQHRGSVHHRRLIQVKRSLQLVRLQCVATKEQVVKLCSAGVSLEHLLFPEVSSASKPSRKLRQRSGHFEQEQEQGQQEAVWRQASVVAKQLEAVVHLFYRLNEDLQGAISALSGLLAQSFFVSYALTCSAGLARLQVLAHECLAGLVIGVNAVSDFMQLIAISPSPVDAVRMTWKGPKISLTWKPSTLASQPIRGHKSQLSSNDIQAEDLGSPLEAVAMEREMNTRQVEEEGMEGSCGVVSVEHKVTPAGRAQGQKRGDPDSPVEMMKGVAGANMPCGESAASKSPSYSNSCLSAPPKKRFRIGSWSEGLTDDGTGTDVKTNTGCTASNLEAEQECTSVSKQTRTTIANGEGKSAMTPEVDAPVVKSTTVQPKSAKKKASKAKDNKSKSKADAIFDILTGSSMF
mmetsp:Transcript_42483/g.51550  ORF Transcript_42483/g.51550 Transcript_42483/m.51550 type:complete len:460 (+) Transcript_42483:236-1615(+)